MELPARPPGKVQAIGVMHLVGGIFNVLVALGLGAFGLFGALFTLGFSLFYCCPAIFLLPAGIMEIVSGARHLSSDHTGLQAPRATAVAEIISILGCSTFSLIFGILTLAFLSDPEVAAYYESKRLPG